MTARSKMPLALLLAGAMTAISAATNAGAEEPQRELAEWARYKAAWNAHDARGIASAFAPDASFKTPAQPQAVQGPAAIAEAVQPMLAAFPDLKLVVTSNTWTSPRTMVERWTLTGTWTERFLSGPLIGVAPSGRPFMIEGASFYEWENGKIKRYENYYDRMSLLGQIGALGGPPDSRRQP